jgi:hypothetical protein
MKPKSTADSGNTNDDRRRRRRRRPQTNAAITITAPALTIKHHETKKSSAMATRSILYKGNFTTITRSCVKKRSKPPRILPSLKHYTTTNKCNNKHANTPESNSVVVPPPPSWSISELRLISGNDDADQLSEEELSTLARRCLIDVRRLSPERREQLRKDVAGIMRCASVLLDVKDMDDELKDLSDVDIYDAPRGLTKIPIRRDDYKESSDWDEAGESRAVMQSESVNARLVDVKGEKFFSVVTKRE